MRTYSKLNEIPTGKASTELIPGCMVLEGGAWRGIYTQGALDYLMQKGINMQTTIGVSAGAMGGYNYAAGQIGRSARLNLHYRHESRYCGLKAYETDDGLTGFHFALEEDHEGVEEFDSEAFYRPDREFVAVATNVKTGKAEYFRKTEMGEKIRTCVKASATVPYVSKPVEIDGNYYLDGGIACKIAYEWALEQGFEKIIVIRTRDKSFRKPVKAPNKFIYMEYKKTYPNIAIDLEQEAPRYNIMLDRLDLLEKQGRVFVLAPSAPITIARFEGDMEKLGAVYWEGYYDAKDRFDDIQTYLNQ